MFSNRSNEFQESRPILTRVGNQKEEGSQTLRLSSFLFLLHEGLGCLRLDHRLCQGHFLFLFLELTHIQFVVGALLREQSFVIALFNDVTMLHD